MLTVCMLGPDGVGKGTVIAELEKIYKVSYFHLSPSLGAVRSVGIEIPMHTRADYSPLVSYLKLFYYLIKYNILWIKNISLSSGKPELCIFDRYIDDMLVDPRRFLYGGSLRIARFVTSLIVSPEVYFVLVAPASEIYSRKPELSVREIEQQNAVYLTLIDDKKYHKIDASLSISNTVSQVTKVLDSYE